MRDIQKPGRSVVMSTNGMIATSQPMATQVGLDILRRGGNALDAAVAASATLCITEPLMTGIGGDCFILYHEAKTGRLHGLNGSGRAPARATLEEFRQRGHDHVPERGVLAVTVPGAVHGWETALDRLGTRGLDELLQPAIRLAEDGYAVSPVVADVWKRHEELLAAAETTRRTMLVAGKAPAAGAKHRLPALGRSLQLIAERGKQAFYEGPLAYAIVDYVQKHDGLIELSDLAAQQSEWVPPISTDYRGLTVCEIPPNSQGIAVLMMLNTLENADLGSMRRLGADHVHLVTEAFKLAIAERNKWVADMAFADVPVGRMLDKNFAKRQFGRIDAKRTLSHPVPSGLPDHRDTVYLAVVDKDRNCCSFINSLYHPCGSGMVAGDTGILLQNRGAGFVLEAGHFNCIQPGKRPLHTIIPAMVYKDHRPILCFGVMGGEYQAMGHGYVLTNWLDFGMDLQEAVDAPRFLPEAGMLTVERGIPGSTRAALTRRGHRLIEADRPLGGGQLIYIDWQNGVLQAASDPRKDGCAMGY